MAETHWEQRSSVHHVNKHEAGGLPDVCVECAGLWAELQKDELAELRELREALDNPDAARCKYKPCPIDHSATLRTKLIDYAVGFWYGLTTLAVIYLLWERVTNGP